ncbi:MAG TPA: helix-turn-helix transcriptional regulator [Paenalcaligenes sp.]|nr:helix-turn-helix transcriptional regulator [Paenalcaligenes sp.]
MGTRTDQEHMTETNTEMSVGPYLKQLREAQGHTLEQVSLRIKYSVPQIQALEQERWDALPDGAPVRWLVRSYGRFLNVEAQAIQSMLDAAFPESVRAEMSTAHKMQWEAEDMALYVEPRQRTWIWWLIAIVLLVVVVFYAIDQGWIPDSWLVFDWLKALRQ